MKKNILEKIEKEIKSHHKISKDKKNQILNKIFKNLLIASGIIIYFILLILAFINIEKQFVIIGYRALSLGALALAIILFEKSYKNDSGSTAVHGIEALVIALITLFLPYIFFKSIHSDRIYVIMVGVYISIYYLLKSIFVYKHEKKKFIKNSNDIKEIVKKESKDKIIAEGIPAVEIEIEEPIKKKTKKAKKSKANKNKNKKTLWNIFKRKIDKKPKQKNKKTEPITIEPEKSSKRGRPKKDLGAGLVPEQKNKTKSKVGVDASVDPQQKNKTKKSVKKDVGASIAGQKNKTKKKKVIKK